MLGWLSGAELPHESFQLWPWVSVTDVARFIVTLKTELSSQVSGPRWRSAAEDLRQVARLYRGVGVGEARRSRAPPASHLPVLMSNQSDFLAVATPGAGKTTFALVAARMVLAERPAPVAARLQLHLDPAWSAAVGGLPSDMHGVVTTYQQVALNPAAVRRLAVGAFVILDEVHHGEPRPG